MDKNLIWMIIGFVGQGFFSARFISSMGHV